MKFNKKIMRLLQGIVLDVCLCFVLISYVPAEASGYNVSFTIKNVGELKPPVKDEELAEMGFPLQDFDYFDNNHCDWSIKPETIVQINWEQSSVPRQYVESVEVYEYSKQYSEKKMSFYSTNTIDALSYSTIVSNDATDVVEFVFNYAIPQDDGSTRTGWLDKYFVIQKDPYNVTFKDIDSNGNIIPAFEGTMYRMFNSNTGEHFYTADVGEANYLLSIGWNYESYAWRAPTSSDKPVYRLFNPDSGEHHYTTNAGEKDYLDMLGWNYEGIGWYSASYGQALYRLYNPNATGAGAHHYTTKATERDWLVSSGWNYEGIGWYGL